MPQKLDRCGEIVQNKYGTYAKIIDYQNWENVIVEFQDEYKYKLHTTYQNFKNGELRNPYDKHICGIAYIGIGDYLIKDPLTNKSTEEYSRWSGIIHRCYDPNDKNKAYHDCKVSEEWLCFQEFAKWHFENYYSIDNEKMRIDKDILFKGNKIYSADKCVFVPEKINLLFKNNKSQRGSSYIGVSKTDGYIRAGCSDENGKYQYLGVYKDELTAFYVYKKYKESVIKKVAEEYKDKIPLKLYKAMCEYEVDLYD